MTPAEEQIVERVYESFNASENGGWEQFDTNMSYMGWLTDNEIYREASLIFEDHVKFDARCKDEHASGEKCPVKIILHAMEILLEKFIADPKLDAKSRYMFEYYICLDQEDMIVTD
jgi:hypothetical protein